VQEVTLNDKLLLASSNQGKLTEFIALAKSAAPQTKLLELALLPNFASLPALDETAPTFAENAAGKALHYSRRAEGLILADDSGLVVPALGGAPGVRSARYAGANATSAQRNEKLLRDMRGLTGEDRRAYFVCVLAVVEKGHPIAIISARVDGEILPAPRGAAGFGYDPIFYLPELDQTFAELPAEQKNHLSHRGKAFGRLAFVLAST
jgi:non-canonical purine NTP pyrophosphatase (RdgB/HAM1 family)